MHLLWFFVCFLFDIVIAGVSGGSVVLHFYTFGMDAGKPSSLEVIIQ